MNIKNIIGLLSLKTLAGVFILHSTVCLMVTALLILAWLGLDIYQNTIEEWR